MLVAEKPFFFMFVFVAVSVINVFLFFNLVINLFPCIIQMLLASRAVFIQSPKCMRYRKKGGRGGKGGGETFR